jgi:hypothetical protein
MRIRFYRKRQSVQEAVRVWQLLICLIGIAKMGLFTASTRLVKRVDENQALRNVQNFGKISFGG